jgi:REP element-mobilizing transposase RayT
MLRIARKNINTSFVHVMVQGVNKNYIFDNKRSLNYYLKSIKSESRHKEFDLIAYCMMNNHAHFLFYVRDMNSFSLFMKSVNQNFANFYNSCQGRVGTIFRNRYQVEPIFDYEHLINCIKYIHNNPVKAGMVDNCRDYPYSSYHDYFYGQGCAKYDILKEVFGVNENYLEVIEAAKDRSFLDFKDDKSYKVLFKDGLRTFMNENNVSLIDVFSERNVLIKLIHFLKQEFKIDYKKSIDYMGLPRGFANLLK